jgi:DNA polymerase III delta prime subunit
MAAIPHVGALIGATVSQMFPGEKSALLTVGAAVAGDMAFRIAARLPSVSTLMQCVARKPNAVFVTNEGPIFQKLETYIVTRYIEQVRACQLEPRNGQITYSLTEIQFHKPLFDEFNGESLQLQLMQSNGSYEVSAESFRTLFYRFTQFNTEPGAALSAENDGGGFGKGAKFVIVSSWTLTVPQLRQYIDSICEFRKNAAITTMYTASISGYQARSDRGRGSESKKPTDAVLTWKEVHVKSNKRLENTVVSKTVERDLVDDVRRFMANEQWYNSKGIPYQRGFILYGPPGTGKTSLLKALAAEFDLPVFIIDFEIIASNAQFAKLMSEINHHVNNRPHIIALEDLDRCKFINSRNSDNSDISVRCLLNEIDGLVESHGRLLFITANDERKLEQIDQEALMRPGRVDRKVKVDYCDFDQVQRLLMHFFGLGHSCIDNLQPSDLAGKYSPATVINLLQQASVNNEAPQTVLPKLFKNQPVPSSGSNSAEDGPVSEVVPLRPSDHKDTPLEKAEKDLVVVNRNILRAKSQVKIFTKRLERAQKNFDEREEETRKLLVSIEKSLAERTKDKQKVDAIMQKAMAKKQVLLDRIKKLKGKSKPKNAKKTGGTKAAAGNNRGQKRAAPTTTTASVPAKRLQLVVANGAESAISENVMHEDDFSESNSISARSLENESDDGEAGNESDNNESDDDSDNESESNGSPLISKILAAKKKSAPR